MNKHLKTTLIIGILITFLYFFLTGLGDALIPLLVSCLFAYLLFPVVKKLETKGVKREIAVLGVLFIFFFISTFSIALIIPNLINDGKEFIQQLPETSQNAINRIEELSADLGYQLNLNKDFVSGYVKEYMSQLSSSSISKVTKGVSSSFKNIARAFLAIFNILLIPLFLFYVINDYEKISKGIKSYIPNAYKAKVERYNQLINRVLKGYIRGQLLVALCLGVMYSLGLAAIGLKFAFLIGIVAGIVAIIPYAGFIIGFGLAVIVALANASGFPMLLKITAVFSVAQALEGPW